jgi:signal transduction histidine kinase/ligand-binding sensor domain-containing protein
VIEDRARIAAFILMSWATTASAERLPLTIYTAADGLPHNEINRIVRDSRGFLWFCTGDGLSRFDGYTFTSYTDEDGLPHPTVTDFLETRHHLYWVATSGGLVRFDPAGTPARRIAVGSRTQGSARPMFAAVLPDDTDPRARAITTVIEDHDGAIWAGTTNGIYRLDERDGQPTLRRVDIGIPRDYPERAIVNDLLVDHDGSLWIATPSGLYRRGHDGSAARYTKREGLPDEFVHDLLEDHTGALWAGTRGGGFFRFAVTSSHEPPVIDRAYSVRDGLPSAWVFQLFETADHTLWIATADGIARFAAGDGESKPFQVYGTRQGLTYHDITAINEDASGNLWLGTNTAGAMKFARGGIITYDRKDGLASINAISQDPSGVLCFRGAISGGPSDQGLIRFGQFDGRRFEWFTPAIVPDVDLGWVAEHVTLRTRSGEWWLGTGAGIFRFPRTRNFTDIRSARPLAHYSTRDGLGAPQVFRLFEDLHGDVWASSISSVANGLARWNADTNTWTNLVGTPGLPPLRDNLARSFGEDRTGNVWIGFNGGVARARAGRFNFFTTTEDLPPGAIMDIHRDQAGHLWLASDRSGLIRVDDADAERPRFMSYTSARGLSSNRTDVIVEDVQGRIYLGTGRGIDRLDPATGRIKHFTTADGLAAGVLRAAYRDRSGVLWFGMTGGLSRLLPTSDVQAAPPAVFVSGLMVGGSRMVVSAVGERLISLPDLKATDNDVQIDFVGLNFARGDTLRYEYTLEGADDTWARPTEQRSVNYANLAPGRYRFLVRALTSDGIASSNPAAISFTILRPIWQRWWFVTLLIVLVGAVAREAYRYRMARILELANMRTRIAVDLHDDIGSNLTKIAILSEVARQQMSGAGASSEGPLASIARISRESVVSMSDIVWAINPQRDRLLNLVRRMRQHAEEVLTGRGVKVSFRAPSDDLDLKLGVDVRRDLYLIFKEAINNIARHAGCSRVDIELRVEGSMLRLDVIDDGCGLDVRAQHDGEGLASMRRRAERLGGSCAVRTSDGIGTTVDVRVPSGGSSRSRSYLNT